MTLQLRIATHSEIGPVRKNNQDSGYASPNLLVVADGMGGAAAGDLASAVAIDTIRRIDVPSSGPQMLEALAGALHRANDRIADLVQTDYALEGMGTTVTGVLFDGSQFALAHIGDSRAYLLHEGHLERLTHDHSWVQSLVDDGKISEDEAAVHPHRSLLLKVLNGQPANDPDLTMVQLQVGDRLLLCSDGLCGLVDDPVIEQAMLLPDLDAALRRLVDEALAEGGIDNITVILADVVESAALAPTVVLGAAAELEIPAVQTRSRPGDDRFDDQEPVPDQPAAPVTNLPPVAAAARAEGGAGSDSPPETDDEQRYSPQPPQHRRSWRPLVALVVVALVVAAGLASAYAWTRTQFYVGADGEQVAIFRGLSDGIPGLSLSDVYEVQPLAVSALPPYYQERVRANIEVIGLAAARQTVTQLAEAAKKCALQATGRPSASARASVASSASPSPVITLTPATPPLKPVTPSRSAPAPTTSSALPTASGSSPATLPGPPATSSPGETR